MQVDEKGLIAAVEALRAAGMKREGSSHLTLGTVIATDLARAAILAYLSARSAEPVAAGTGAIVVEQPYHGGRYVIAYKGGTLNGWSYPSAEAAQADLDEIRVALLQPTPTLSPDPEQPETRETPPSA